MKINIIGGGLAGASASLYLAKRGYTVNLYDIKGQSFTPAHHNPNYAEIVCSNSLKSLDPTTASGLLKEELKLLDSDLINIAYQTRVPSGHALAVDREKFAQEVTNQIRANKNIICHTEEVDNFEKDAITILATGPLTTDKMCDALSKKIGKDFFYFYDAASPIIDAKTIDMNIAFVQDRYDKGDGDYLNLPMNREEYEKFYDELIKAECVELKNFEKGKYFESCMPIEVMAKRGKDTIRFGPLKPVGLTDKRTGQKPYAVVQLRKENTSAETYNMVGFQTNLKFGEQKRVFSLIPGLKDAEFLKYGVMHKNNYINFPSVCDKYSRLKVDQNIFVAGQLSGVEGYVESIMSGLYCAMNTINMIENRPLTSFSNKTIIGGIYNYLEGANKDNFQPINANFGVLEPVAERDKQKKCQIFYDRSIDEIKKVIDNNLYNC